MVVFHAKQDPTLIQTDRKIDSVVASLKTTLQSHKPGNIKYLAGLYLPAYWWLWDFIACGYNKVSIFKKRSKVAHW